MDPSRAQRRMEVAARIKELRAGQHAQPDPTPAPAGDLAAPPAVPAPAPPPAVTEPGAAEESASAASTLADLLRNSGGLLG